MIKVVISFVDIWGFIWLFNIVLLDKIVMFLNKYFGVMMEFVEVYGGEVFKFIGDEVMVIFLYEIDDEVWDVVY